MVRVCMVRVCMVRVCMVRVCMVRVCIVRADGATARRWRVMRDTASDTASLPTERENYFHPPRQMGQWRAQTPVRRLTFADGHLGWLVTSYSGVRAVLADNRFSTRIDLHHPPTPENARQWQMPIPAGFFLRMDPPDHTRYRRLLTGHFTVRRMKQLEPRIEEFASGLLDEMEREGPPADLVQAFAQPLPLLVICELLGIPYADRDLFQRHGDTIIRRDWASGRMKEAARDLLEYSAALVARKRVQPADDLLSDLAAGGELSDPELVGVVSLLLLAGYETTVNMLALGTFALLLDPVGLAVLRDDPSAAAGAADELLRYLTISEFQIRTALEDVELDGHTIRAGESVVVSLTAANRDPERFEAPDTLDLTRQAAGHLAFGHGIHQCLGSQLARNEIRIALPALLKRFRHLRLDVPPAEVPLRSDTFYGTHRLPVSW
jgi:cytochrome P450